jgi:hypothetical protein
MIFPFSGTVLVLVVPVLEPVQKTKTLCKQKEVGLLLKYIR